MDNSHENPHLPDGYAEQLDTAESVQSDAAAGSNAIAELFAQTVGGAAVADVTDFGIVVTITVPWSNVSDLRTPANVPPPVQVESKQDGQDQ